MNIPIKSEKDINATVLTGVDGKQLMVVGTAEIELSIAAYACCMDFVVIENIAHSVILGLEALNNLQAVVDLSNSTLSIANNPVTTYPCTEYTANGNGSND